jgi:HlyD family secretion protein
MTNPNDNALTQGERTDAQDGRGRPATLSDRVRSLRLGERAPGGGGSRLPWVLCVLLLGSTFAFGFQAFRQPRGDDASNKPGPDDPANARQADSKDIALQAKGYIIAAHQMQVTPEVAGKIEWLHPDFEEGRRFETWMVLARLKTVDYRADLARAKAVLAMEQKNLAQIEFQTALDELKARARLVSSELEEVRSRRDWDRVGDPRVLASPKERDESRTSFERAVETRKEARASLEEFAKGGPKEKAIDAAKAKVRQAEADQAKAQEHLDCCFICPPTKGTILTKKAEYGNLVNPIAFNISASLCEMADLSDLEVDLSIQERDIPLVYVGQDCTVMPEAYQKNDGFLKKHKNGYKGRVSRLMPIADRAKGAIPVRVKLNAGEIPPEEEGVYLKPDMGVMVSFKKPTK